jgi:outer membrane receptor protein involved in Fe transport
MQAAASLTTVLFAMTASQAAGAGGSQTQNSASPSATETESGAQDKRGIDQLAEVIVTAEKREERLQDVPVPVTALAAATLLEQNAVRLQDYYASVPGLSMTTSDFGWPLLSIRGLTTGGYSNPTVAVTVDDVPYGSSTAIANGEEVPDIDPSDLARVEVLRGPQGSLYGASSLGGLLKYVTVDPSTSGVSGRVEAGVSNVVNGAEEGYTARGAVNLPITDTLAIRVSGFVRRDPGYIDNVLTGQKGVNEVEAYGGFLSALWKPSEDFSVKFTTLLQYSRGDGLPLVDVGQGLGPLRQNDVAGTGGSHIYLEAHALTIKARLAGIDLTSVSGFNIKKYEDSQDFTYGLGTVNEGVFGVTGTPQLERDHINRLTEELRLSSSIGQHIDWLAGVFYDHESSHYLAQFLATVPTTGEIRGIFAHAPVPNTFMEYAGFADVTYHFTDNFDVQLGGRESHNHQTLNETISGPYTEVLLGVPSPAVYPQTDSGSSSFTYLLTPRYKISPDLMVYARFASGYRPGGPNYNVGSVPLQYGPDKTQNYEVGMKGDAFEHRFTFDTSIYYINWEDIQLQLINPTSYLVYYSNGSRAKSEGIELSGGVRPVSGLSISAWVTWNEAVLTQPLPAASTAYGAVGDSLPYSSRWSANSSINEEYPLYRSLTGFVGGDVSYVGQRAGVFGSTSASSGRQIFPAYVKTDVRAGVKYDTWTLNFYVNNVADRRGVIGGGLGTFIPYAFELIQPRTAGLTVSKTF